MRSVTICPGVKELILGYQGENLAQQIAFDCNGWGNLYGSGVYELTVQPPNGGTPYPVTVTVSGNQVLWTVTDVDTATAGTGKAQLSYYVGAKLAKSQVWPTKILRSVGATGDAPDAYETWLSTLQALAAETLQNSQNAEDSAEDAAASAAAAALSETNAGTSETNAGTSETNAAASALAAAGYASSASTSEGNALLYKQAAESARDAAVIAQGKAEDAQDAAEDAQTAAEAAQAAIENMTVSSTTLSPGSSATVAKTESGGVVNLAFGLPQGAKGDTGATGPAGATGATGPQGPAGVGIPTGGTTGQVLKKASGSNYDTVWANESGGGGGGDMLSSVYDPAGGERQVAFDNSVVHLTGNETVTGTKTFGIINAVNVDLLDSDAGTTAGIIAGYYDNDEDESTLFLISDAARVGDVGAPIPVTGIAAPTGTYDAVNKGYVDTIVGDIETLLAAI